MGPITLGQPDAELTVRSNPAGAEVTIGGHVSRPHAAWWRSCPRASRTTSSLSLPGYANYTQVRVRGRRPQGHDRREDEAGARARHRAGRARGCGTVRRWQVARPHAADAEAAAPSSTRSKCARMASCPSRCTVTPAPASSARSNTSSSPRTRPRRLQESAPTVTPRAAMRCGSCPRGTFKMGSERREQGRRPNEGLRAVTLQRPYYIGVTEVTNAEFRKFRSSHVSGYIDKQVARSRRAAGRRGELERRRGILQLALRAAKACRRRTRSATANSS